MFIVELLLALDHPKSILACARSTSQVHDFGNDALAL
jgi:hypothetical protein